VTAAWLSQSKRIKPPILFLTKLTQRDRNATALGNRVNQIFLSLWLAIVVLRYSPAVSCSLSSTNIHASPSRRKNCRPYSALGASGTLGAKAMPSPRWPHIYGCQPHELSGSCGFFKSQGHYVLKKPAKRLRRKDRRRSNLPTARPGWHIHRRPSLHAL